MKGTARPDRDSEKATEIEPRNHRSNKAVQQSGEQNQRCAHERSRIARYDVTRRSRHYEEGLADYSR